MYFGFVEYARYVELDIIENSFARNIRNEYSFNVVAVQYNSNPSSLVLCFVFCVFFLLLFLKVQYIYIALDANISNRATCSMVF